MILYDDYICLRRTYKCIHCYKLGYSEFNLYGIPYPYTDR